MSYRKYLNDYRVEQYTDEKGRVRTGAVYIGGDFVLSRPFSAGDKRLVLALSILPWLSIIGALIPNTGASRAAYVIMPYVFSALPLFFLTDSAFALQSRDEFLTRERAHRISSRLSLGSLFAAVLSAASFIALILTAIFKWVELFTSDILFGALSLITAAMTSIVFYKYGKGLKSVKTD